MVVKPDEVYKNIEFTKKVNEYVKYFDSELLGVGASVRLSKYGNIFIKFPDTFNTAVLESALSLYDEFWIVKTDYNSYNVEFIPKIKESPRG